MKIVEESEAKEFVSSLEFMEVSHAWRGYGSAIFMELGRLKEVGRKNPKGECAIMVEWSWRFEEGNSIKIGSWSEVELINALCARLIGLKLASISFYSRLKEIELGFNDNSYFLSFATAEGDPQWAIRSRGSHWLSFENGQFQVR